MSEWTSARLSRNGLLTEHPAFPSPLRIRSSEPSKPPPPLFKHSVSHLHLEACKPILTYIASANHAGRGHCSRRRQGKGNKGSKCSRTSAASKTAGQNYIENPRRRLTPPGIFCYRIVFTESNISCRAIISR